MKALLHMQQRSTEWLEMRKNKIGASDAPIIMGLSPWLTPYQLWEQKVGLQGAQAETGAMRRGIEMEDQARDCFERMTALTVFPQVMIHPDYDWMMASLDGMDIEQNHIVEIKCAGREDHQLAKSGKVPEKYYPQLQHQLEVTGLDMVYYFSYDGSEGVIVEVGRNTRYIWNLVDEERAFHRCVKDFYPPDLSTRDYQEKTDDVWGEAASEWMKIQKKIHLLESVEKKLRDTLVSMSGGKNSRGGGVRVAKSIRKGTIDYTKIPELEEVDLDVYRKEPIEVWRIIKE